MKGNAVILFKFQSRWNDLIINKLSYEFNISILFLSDLIMIDGYKKALIFINKYIEKNNINVVFIDVEFFPEIDVDFIRCISNKIVKVSMYFDDLLMHDFNAITASYSDLVLTADPISVLKYKEKGIDAEFFPLEANKNIFYDRKIIKDIDVLFDGTIKKVGRRQYIEYLRSNGVNVKVLEEGNKFIPYDDFGQLISRSKIALDFSKTHEISCSTIDNNSRPYPEYFKYYFQLKGRPIQVGLCKTVCISEYTPALNLLFSKDEVPTFKTHKECLNLINQLLNDENKLKYYAENLNSKVLAEYEDEVYMKKLYPKIKKKVLPLCEFNPVPAWYRKKTAEAQIRTMSSYPFRHSRELIYVLSKDHKITFSLLKIIVLKYISFLSRKLFVLVGFKSLWDVFPEALLREKIDEK